MLKKKLLTKHSRRKLTSSGIIFYKMKMLASEEFPMKLHIPRRECIDIQKPARIRVSEKSALKFRMIFTLPNQRCVWIEGKNVMCNTCWRLSFTSLMVIQRIMHGIVGCVLHCLCTAARPPPVYYKKRKGICYFFPSKNKIKIQCYRFVYRMKCHDVNIQYVFQFDMD